MNAEPTPMAYDLDGDRKLCARIDISKASQAADFELGDVVEITIRGKVKSLRGPEETMRPEYNTKDGKPGKDKKHVYPGSIELEIESFKVDGGTDFSPMMDE